MPRPFRALAARSWWIVVACNLLLFAGCAWKPWIPGEKSWNPPVVVDLDELSAPLGLDGTLVDELSCYAKSCEKRFRLVLEQGGTLTVRAIVDLRSANQQARLILEAPSGPLGQDGTGRGPRVDVTPLVVRRDVARGTYFVMLQTIGGGPASFELSATLSAGEALERSQDVVPEPVVEEAPDSMAEPPRFAEVPTTGGTVAGYDPALVFDDLRSFAFPATDAAPGSPVPTPTVRRVRRYIANALELKGFRQASGGEAADLLVDFSAGETPRARVTIPWLNQYALYDPPSLRGQIVIDIVEPSTKRIAWHATAQYAAGREDLRPDERDAALRAAVTEALGGFPPR